MKKTQLKDILVFGFALFAMFFGAGNLIFPPVLGLGSGNLWFVAFIGFFIMDAGLAVLGIFTMLNVQGDMQRVSEPLGHRVSLLLTVVMVLCIGPCLGIPRTGAVSYSMVVQPLLNLDSGNRVALLIFSLVFYAIVLTLSIKPHRVVNIVGNYLTPVLLLSLLATILIGVLKGHMAAADVISDSPIKEGVYNGYQTMDGMASLLFSGMMIQSLLKQEGGSESQSRVKIAWASLVAGILLFIVYGGLTYLGRVWGLPFKNRYYFGELDSAGLLTCIEEAILGKAGLYILSVCALFACLTTAIGLTSGIAQFFEKLLHQKLSYKKLCVIICVIGCGFCNFGLSEIIAIAAPILNLVYPPITVLLVLGVFRSKLPERLPWCLGTGAAFAVSFLGLLCDTFGLSAFAFIHSLPLDSYGLGFALPSVLGVLLGLLLKPRKKAAA